MRLALSQVNALSRVRQAAESPAFPPGTHRIGAVAHKSSTCLCTDSTEAVILPAADQRAAACVPGDPSVTRGIEFYLLYPWQVA